ncbi:unnamed protein product, partial [Amoebophrya sp. A25]
KASSIALVLRDMARLQFAAKSGGEGEIEARRGRWELLRDRLPVTASNAELAELADHLAPLIGIYTKPNLVSVSGRDTQSDLHQ